MHGGAVLSCLPTDLDESHIAYSCQAKCTLLKVMLLCIQFKYIGFEPLHPSPILSTLFLPMLLILPMISSYAPFFYQADLHTLYAQGHAEFSRQLPFTLPHITLFKPAL
jgi:hypothetical protein